MALLFWALLQSLYLTVVSKEGPVVSTKYGLVEGLFKTNSDGSPYDLFRGIPFGASTAGNARWKKPAEPAAWDGVLSAKEYGRTCPQLGLPWANENCLYVNVYVPDSVEEHQNDTLPVMVYFYGGAFLLGSARTYDAQLLSTRGRVVVVTFNYRVGVVGFLSTESEVSPGNYGLWDQVAVLRWVQENIASFGGDSDRVTIIGQSAGGMSVSHLALSPVAQGLFHRVIALSGSALSPVALTFRQKMAAKNFGRKYECPTNNDDDLVECLRGINSVSLNLNGVRVPGENGYIPNFVPVVDNELISVQPIEAMERGLNSNYDLLAGRTQDDGLIFSAGSSDSKESFWDHLLLVFSGWKNKEQLVQMVFNQYPDLNSDSRQLRYQAGSQMMTDYLFGCGVYQEVGYHSQSTEHTGKGTYFYEFDYSYFFKNTWISGVHLEDVLLLLGDSSPLFKFDEVDKIVSRNLQSYYANFAYTGNPNEGPHPVPTEWPQYDVINKLQLRESANMTSERVSDEVLARYNWWNEVFYPTAVPVDTSQDDIETLSPSIHHRRKLMQLEDIAHRILGDPMQLTTLNKEIMHGIQNHQPEPN